MRFSVLIPTRNRLEYLGYAVETVRRQAFEDWELIIVDNASDEDVSGYVRGFGDRRIVYSRSDEFISVTDNWNRAVELATGDYLIMLGDDDGLLPDSLRMLHDLAERFEEPDAIYLNTLLFAFPGAVPDFPDGYLAPYGYALFLRGVEEPYRLERAERLRCVRDALDFKVRYGFNMQFVAVSRRLVERMEKEGPFYRSAFPDYFAMNAIFLRANDIVVTPEPAVVIGISPKSYGHYYAKGEQSRGDEFLKSFPGSGPDRELEETLLPGDSINNGWLHAMILLERAYGPEFDFEVNKDRYRTVQIRAMARDAVAGRVDGSVLRRFLDGLTTLEKVRFRFLVVGLRLARTSVARPLARAASFAWQRIAPLVRGAGAQFIPWSAKRQVGLYRTTLDVFEHCDPATGLRRD